MTQTALTPQDHPDPGQKKLLSLYAAFGVTIIFSVLPYMFAVILSIVFFLGVLIAAYAMRSKAPEDSLVSNHATFIIRTIWIGGFFALFTVIMASIYLQYANLDNGPLEPCLELFLRLNPDTILDGLQKNQGAFEICAQAFVMKNFKTFLIAGLIAGGPVMLYFTLRYARGLSRAIGGYRVAKPKGWL